MKKIKRDLRYLFLVVLPFALTAACTSSSKDLPWRELFNGTDLEGWVVLNGEAPYHVENGEIVGTTVPNTPNSFLTTGEVFSDFIMEFEVLVDTSMNSGVQIRSQSRPDYQDGRVHGYQVEIDPSERAWSGGIYDEARRGWIYSLSGNEAGRAAFNRFGWNKYRVEAIGDTLKTWINGVPCAWVVDNADSEGIIAFQVHSINANYKPWAEGKQVRWRNIRILTEQLEEARSKEALPIEQVNTIPNTITSWEKSNGWRLLFDGETTNGWRGAYKEVFPEFGWKVENGELIVIASGGAESDHGGDIVTLDEFENFELVLDFKITPGANSGIKYYVTEKENNVGSAIGPEFQILDDALHPDAKQGRDGNRTIGSLYDLITAQNKRVNPVGTWNRARIVSNNKQVEHWLNGMKVVEYTRGSEAFRELVAKSKYHVWENFGEAPKGRILLQDHGDEVAFRSIKVRNL